MQFSISLIKMRNKIGPKTVPWGTPLRIIEMRATIYNCWRLERKDSIHLTIFSERDSRAGGVVVSLSAFYAGGRGFDSRIRQS